MAIEQEFFGLTGIIGTGMNDLLVLSQVPSTGPNGAWDVAVDPTDGPAQRLGIDFGVTHLNIAGTTAAIALNLVNSDIKDVMNNFQAHGVTGLLTLRVLYNYAT